MLKGFRDFVTRGNVIDLAVAVVIGAAFTALVNSFVVNFINPIIGALGGKDLVEKQYGATVQTYEGRLQADKFFRQLSDAGRANDFVFVLGFEAIDAMMQAAEAMIHRPQPRMATVAGPPTRAIAPTLPMPR